MVRKYIGLLVMFLIVITLAVTGADKARANTESTSTESTGVLINVVGTGSSSDGADKTKANGIGVVSVVDMVVDSEHNVYFIITNQQRVYKVSPQGDFSVYAGLGTYPANTTNFNGTPVTGQLRTAAAFTSPNRLAIDSEDNLYIGESGGRVTKVDVITNSITVVAEGGTNFSSLRDIAVDSQGALYILTNGTADRQKVYKVNVPGNDPVNDPQLYVTATIPYLSMMDVDSEGDLYFISESPMGYDNFKVWKYDADLADNPWIAVAGKDSNLNSTLGGPATNYYIEFPKNITINRNDHVYITNWLIGSEADRGHQVLKIDSDGNIHLIAGTTEGSKGISPEMSIAAGSQINSPDEIAVHPTDGTVYYFETNAYRIRAIKQAYLVEYDGNGHTGGTIPANVIAFPGTNVQIPSSLIKTHYTFGGWNNAADSGNNYQAGDSFTPTSNVKFIANWIPNTYTYTYIAGDNGTLTSNGVANQSQVVFSDIPYNTSVPYEVTAVQDPGYVFNGWSDNGYQLTRQDIVTNDREVTARFLKLHTVTLNTNGGPAINPLRISDGRTITQEFMFGDPVNPPHEFAGWYTDAELTIPFNIAQDQVTSDITLHAKWTNYYTVTFEMNGGTPINSASVEEGANLEDQNPQRTGYTFVGWYTDLELETEFEAATTPITEDITLYAKWETSKYTVTFVMNGGDSISSQIVEHDNLVSDVTPTKAGHEFAGWYTDAGFDNSFNITTPITSDTTLHANWNILSYTVIFETNGGTSVSNQTIPYNSLVSDVTTTLTGYTLVGWYTDDEFSEEFTFATTPITEDITLYAKWETSKYTVTFDMNGGDSISSQIVEHDNLVSDVTPTKAGHEFAGWYTDAGFNNSFNITTPITSDTTLHANWNILSYTVIFETNGGTSVSNQTIQYNNLVTGVTTTKTGHTFAGWYTDEEFENPFDMETSKITGTTTLHATWDIINYTVTFVTNGGESINSQSVPYNGLVMAVTPTKAGHTFAGWYTDDEFSDEFIAATTPITEDITLFAKWGIISYTVTFETNGGDPINSQSVPYNGLVAAVTPTKAGHTFAGWYTDEEFENPFDMETSKITGTTTLHATWNIVNYTVTFVTYGGTPVDNVIVQYNNLITADVTTTKPEYTHVGWYTDADLEHAFSIAVMPITEDTTLYAKWVVTPPGAPTIVSITPDNASIELVWDAVPYATGYMVYQGTVSGTLGTLAATVTDTVYRYEATGLTNGVAYYYVVSAVNDGGENQSIEVSATPLSVAAAPTNVTAVAGDGQVQITFTAPVDHGGSAITGYRVTAMPGNVTVTTTFTKVVIPGLTNGTAYTFTVEALNVVGYGAGASSNEVIPAASSGGSSGGSGNTGGTINDSDSTAEPIVSTDGIITVPVGAAGEVKLGEEIAISIPAGASEQELQLTVEQVVDLAGLADAGEVFASPVFELLKNFSDNFTEPVVLTFKFDASKVQEGKRVAIFYYDEDSKTWVEVGGTISGDTISAEVDHFTKFAVLVVDDVPTDAKSEEPEIPSFSDIAGHWGEANIKQAVQQGVVSGYTDGTFKPNATVTRAEFSVLLARALNMDGAGASLDFIDAQDIHAWAKQAVAQAVEANIISGYLDNSFRPAANITRTELAAMIARGYSTEAVVSATSVFADDNEIPSWAKGAVAQVKELGIVQGKNNNRFAPMDTATRAEAVTMIINLLQVMK